ncbi:recombinase family protein [Mucilaginibacter sp. SP1R1]|uniref:recombinase family protein n=1 Tax=Mucilaginibacter sp. SP1R1 TaxID=2723091 RepID=UPI00161E7759|nr:recombinase family protein [Mucilaginibacter sp. SP1R1]MBB6151338.1 DNA invertase Pin-like site-specific DNA recombinase [Mucilaginibacter sp. SP1R1]
MKTAVLYIRVSTDEQADKGYSQRYQEEVLLQYCQINLLKVKEVVFEDHSAKSFNRPAWKIMLSDFKRKKTQRPDFLLFIKWDRFSRNAADAYQMIRLLNEYGIDPQAIEQPLDLSIPENKMMLAFYLAVPEVENDRRALNIFHGMRRARKEGRFMGVAPLGYVNKTDEDGRKYICPTTPDSELIKWAFLEIADGKYNTEQIWKEAKKKGLVCSSSNFRELVRNPVYCGKIVVAKYKDEPMHWVNGQHEAIISEAIFLRVQQILDDRKKGQIKKKFIEHPQLILRGFLTCPDCGRMLTGSASTGSYARYYYYHCRTSCRYRKRADSINEIFAEELIKWRPNEEFLPLFKSILKECYEIKMCLKIEKRAAAIKQLVTEHSKFNRARELLLSENLSLIEFETIKTDYIFKLQDLQEIVDNTPDYIEKFGLSVHNQGSSILRLYDFFKMANTKDQRRLIGLISPANLTFNGTGFDIKQYGLAMKLIYHS